MNFSLYCFWGPAVSVSLTLDVNAAEVCFFSILKRKVLMLLEFKLGVSVLQSRCNLEIFGNEFVASKSFFLGKH